jgi:hypothetical protein
MGNPFENQQLTSISHQISSNKEPEIQSIKSLNEMYEKLIQSITLNN